MSRVLAWRPQPAPEPSAEEIIQAHRDEIAALLRQNRLLRRINAQQGELIACLKDELRVVGST